MFKYELIGDNDYIFDVIGTLSQNRDVSNLNDYLELDKSVTQDWKILKNIHNVKNTIAKHVDNGSKIYIVVDSDADGYTSASILYQYLKLQNEELDITYHIHDKKIHGIASVSDDLEIDLLLIPDASSNEEEEHKRFHDKGIDVVVIDHHEVDCEESKYATIVNPYLNNQGNLSLSGAGVVYKVCQALDEHYNTDFSDYFLDLVAVGNVADMMSLKELETRYLINEGLLNINNSFLQALIAKQEYSMKSKLNPTTIGFYIAPLINAVTRIGTIQEREDMFKAFIEHKELVEYKPRGKDKSELIPFITDFARQCVNIKSRQDRAKNKMVDSIIESAVINESDKVLLLKDMNIDNGSKGLIANQLASKFMKPIIIVDYNKKEDLYTGSGRSYGGFDELRDILNESEYIEYAKGHGSAFGVGISNENIGKITLHLNELMSNIDFSKKFKVDFLIPLKSMNSSIIEEISELSPVWGKDIIEPKLVINDFKLNDVNFEIIGSKLDTIQMQRGNITYIMFKQKEEDILNIKNAKEIEVVGTCSVNTYKGVKQYQIIIDDINIIK
ncbi:DHH family phosphoesterase [Lysinibacillus sp. NPDC086135]|uniref:DHH family phosphoesterase n=1 Tax=Lysinibacillus sp. NPDC086135 TaxID=3364130 RepID=UPI00382071B8